MRWRKMEIFRGRVIERERADFRGGEGDRKAKTNQVSFIKI